MSECRSCQGFPRYGPNIVRYGRYYRSSDSRWIQRFRCTQCGRHYSSASSDPCYRQNKRRLNYQLKKLFTSGVSMREAARLFKISRTTVSRKMIFLGLQAQAWQREFQKSTQIAELQFDDMESFEHTKMKPLSITLAVQKRTRLILGFKVAKMPAKGLLAKRARKKYGLRVDERKKKRRELFEEIKYCLHPQSLIESDQNPHYKPDVRHYFPSCFHKTYKGRRGCVVGQGELKSGGWDPLFSLNHTYAMLRANMNRLFRRTWCTTKNPKMLSMHIAIYCQHHNQRILKKIALENQRFSELAS